MATPSIRYVESASAGWKCPSGFHIVTYAEDGFAPLSIYGEEQGLTKAELVAFSGQVNSCDEAGSLHPLAPISAIPRQAVRSASHANQIPRYLVDFFRANKTTIHAQKVVFDFRTPQVPGAVLRYLEQALRDCEEAGPLEEVVVVR